jgi:hypothetical protein
MFVSYILAIAILYVKYKASRLDVRPRLAWATLAVTVAIVTFALDFIITTFGFLQGEVANAFVGMMLGSAEALILALLFAQLIADGDLMRVQFALYKTIIYGLPAAALVALGAVVNAWVAPILTQLLGLPISIFGFTAAFAVLVALLVERIQRGVEPTLNRLVFPKRWRAMRDLEDLRASMRECRGASALCRSLVDSVREALHLSFAVLFEREVSSHVFSSMRMAPSDGRPALRLGPNSEIIRILAATQTSVVGPSIIFRDLEERTPRVAIAVPIFFARTMRAFLVCGFHTDGTSLDPDERSTLLRVAESAGATLDAIRADDSLRTNVASGEGGFASAH